MQKTDPQEFKKCCTVAVNFSPYDGKLVDLSEDLIRACEMESEEAVNWSKQRQDQDNVLFDHWKRVFSNLGESKKFQAVQRKYAKYYMDKAKSYMKELGLNTDRALCLLFDICVQMGSIKQASMDRYRAEISSSKMNEKQMLQALARSVAPQAGAWSSDVLSRKMAIASGSGVVHGEKLNLDAIFGLNDNKAIF